jgi:hypothetical protein
MVKFISSKTQLTVETRNRKRYLEVLFSVAVVCKVVKMEMKKNMNRPIFLVKNEKRFQDPKM